MFHILVFQLVLTIGRQYVRDFIFNKILGLSIFLVHTYIITEFSVLFNLLWNNFPLIFLGGVFGVVGDFSLVPDPYFVPCFFRQLFIDFLTYKISSFSFWYCFGVGFSTVKLGTLNFFPAGIKFCGYFSLVRFGNCYSL